MEILAAADSQRRSQAEKVLETFWPGITRIGWVSECRQALELCRASTPDMVLLDLSLLRWKPERWRPLWQAVPELCCMGRAEELSFLPAEVRGNIKAFFPLPTGTSAIRPDAQRIVLENYLMSVQSGSATRTQSERFARMMGLQIRGKSMIGICILMEKSVLAEEAATVERILRSMGVVEACFVPGGERRFLGAATLRDVPGPRGLERLCDGLREELKALGGREMSVTLGVSLSGTEPDLVEDLLEQADLAAFYHIYDGTDRTYLWGQANCRPGSGTFREVEHLGELNKAITQLDPKLMEIALQHMFRDIAQCRLGRSQLRRVLVEVMALLFSAGLDGDIPFLLGAEGNAALNFEFINHIESIETEYESFLAVFLQMIQYLWQKKQRVRQYSSKVRRVMGYIEENYWEKLELSVLAEKVGLSANYLCYLFKKETGFRVVEYVNLIRMERAKELIRDQGLSAAQAAEQVGFADTAYFCTMFKRYTGLTVTEYRNHTE